MLIKELLYFSYIFAGLFGVSPVIERWCPKDLGLMSWHFHGEKAQSKLQSLVEISVISGF